MVKWQLDINCPICGEKFLATRALKHKNKKHLDITPDEFTTVIKGALERGENVLNTKRAVAEGGKLGGKSVFDMDVRNSAKWFSIVPGGAISLGKKK
jgi:hypothetical protein